MKLQLKKNIKIVFSALLATVFAILVTHAPYARASDYWYTDGSCGINFTAKLSGRTTIGKPTLTTIDKVEKYYNEGGTFSRIKEKYKNGGADIIVDDGGKIFEHSFSCLCPPGPSCGV